jgi:hypothetical protein
LSDGTSTLIAMVTEKVDKVPIPKHSIIKVRGFMNVNVVSGRQILVFKETPRLLFTGLKKDIGEPREYEKNLADANQAFEKTKVDLSIPVQDTSEWSFLGHILQNGMNANATGLTGNSSTMGVKNGNHLRNGLNITDQKSIRFNV